MDTKFQKEKEQEALPEFGVGKMLPDGDGIEKNNETAAQRIEYTYEGYRIRVHFAGEKTLRQCVENLLKRGLEIE